MQVNWKQLKEFVDNTGLIRNLNYMELSDAYHVWINYENQLFEVNLLKGTVEYENFEGAYKPRCILKEDINANGQRNMMSNAPLNGETALVYNMTFYSALDKHDDPKGWVHMHLLNDQCQEVTSDFATKTCVDFTPPFSYWIYVGKVNSFGQDGTILKLNGLVAPDYTPEQGGSVEFIINKTIQPLGITDMSTQTGGAHLIYNPEIPGLNTVRLTISHPQGYVSKFEMELFIYRELTNF